MTFEKWHTENLSILMKITDVQEQIDYRAYISMIVTLAKSYVWKTIAKFDAETRRKVKKGEYPNRFGDKQDIMHHFQLEYGGDENRKKQPTPNPKNPKNPKGGNKQKICSYFNTPAGCKKGDKCDFKHVEKK